MPEQAGAGAAALIVFAKAPAAGNVKTRLVPPLTAAEAAALSEAFLRDGLARYAAPGAFGEACGSAAVRLYLAGEEDLPPDAVPAGVSRHRQRGDGLGARMERAFAETFAAGYGRAVVVGTDHPTLPLAFLGEAFRAIETPRTVVIGPSDDGGYYALGLNDPIPGLFRMDYSHAGVFAETLRRALDAGANAVVLPPWYDVDDEADLRRLLAAWRAGADVPPRTADSLKALLDAHPGLL